MKFSASSTNRTGNFQPNANCKCSAEPLYIANIKNAHLQSLLPKEVPIEPTNVQNANKNVTRLLQCKDCEYPTSRQKNLKRHINLKHTLKLDLTLLNSNRNKKSIENYQCDFCKKSYTQKHHLIRHVKAQHEKNLN